MFNIKRKEMLEPLVLSLIFISIFYITFDKYPTYDSVKHLIVAEEITQRGIPTYFESVYWQHPPLLHYLIAAASILFKIHVYYGAKIVILGLSFLSLFIFYLLCREIKGTNFARLSTAMLAFTPLFWSNANDIMQAMGEVFFFITTIYFFYHATKTGEIKPYVLTGIFLGLGMLMRVSAIVIIPILIAYRVFEKRRDVIDLNAIKRIVLIFLVAILIISPYYIYRTNNGGPSMFNQAVEETLKGKAGWLASGDISSPPLQYVTDFFSIASFTTPFLIIGIYFALKRKDRLMSLPLLWFSITMIALSILSHKESRFMIIGLPAIVMLSAYGILGLKEYFKKKEKLFYIIPALLLIALFYSGFSANTNDGYWPFNFELWGQINNLDSGVIVDTVYENGTIIPYGIVKLMTNKYSDYIHFENDPDRDIATAISYNTPYLIYPGDPKLDERFIKMKYFSECNCSLYRINETLFMGTELEFVDQNNLPLDGARITLFNFNGEYIYSSRANQKGIVLIPTFNFAGIMVADKVCYDRIQQIIKIENGTFQMCEQKQIYNGLLAQTALECAQKEPKLQLTYIGCLNHKYAISRY